MKNDAANTLQPPTQPHKDLPDFSSRAAAAIIHEALETSYETCPISQKSRIWQETFHTRLMLRREPRQLQHHVGYWKSLSLPLHPRTLFADLTAVAPSLELTAVYIL